MQNEAERFWKKSRAANFLQVHDSNGKPASNTGSHLFRGRIAWTAELFYRVGKQSGQVYSTRHRGNHNRGNLGSKLRYGQVSTR